MCATVFSKYLTQPISYRLLSSAAESSNLKLIFRLSHMASLYLMSLLGCNITALRVTHSSDSLTVHLKFCMKFKINYIDILSCLVHMWRTRPNIWQLTSPGVVAWLESTCSASMRALVGSPRTHLKRKKKAGCGAQTVITALERLGRQKLKDPGNS